MGKLKLKQDALKYIQYGFSIIPVNRNKKPILNEWKEYQERKVTENEVEQWFFDYNPEGIAIVTGKISGIVVLDVEKGGSTEGLQIPNTPTVRTGGGGYHYYFRHPQSEKVSNSVRFRDLMDIRGDGGYVLAPPSVHKSGRHYEWIINLDTPLADAPEWLLDKKYPQEAKTSKYILSDWESILFGVDEGHRHDSATRIVGKLLKDIPQEDWDDIVYPIMELWNEKNNPPLDDKELNQIFVGISSKEIEKRESQGGKKKRNLLTVADVLNHKPADNPFLVDKLVPSRAIVALTGHPGHNKSWIMLHMAQCIAKGEPIFGQFSTSQGKVLIVDEEDGLDEIKRRLQMLQYERDLPIYFFTLEGFKIDNNEDLDYLLKVVKKEQISLVICDPFVAMHSKVENNAEEAQRVMEALQKFNEIGATVMFIHHHRKDSFKKSNAGQSIRGSSAFSGRLDSHIAVDKVSSDGITHDMNIQHEKSRRGQNAAPFSISLVEVENKINFEGYKELVPAKLKKDEAKEGIISILEDEVLIREELKEAVKQNFEVGDRNIDEALRELVEGGLVTYEKNGRKRLYKLSELSEE